MGLLEVFVKREGHAKVPFDYKTADGYRVGKWVNNQRAAKGKLAPDRTVRLEALPGWCWNALSDHWDVGFRHLKEYANQEGHSKVTQNFKSEDGYRVGQWVAVQRRSAGGLSPERKARLEALPGWSWDALSDQWEEWFCYLKEFAEREGHAKVPRKKHKMADGYRFGIWVTNQRAAKNKLSPERKARLEALPGWSWDVDVYADRWEEGFLHLKNFVDQEGHAKITFDYIMAGGYRLGQWVRVQRRKKENMSPECKARLEALPGWSWDPFLDMWEEGFRYLKEYADREGDCLVPSFYKTEDGYRLGQWVIQQRATKDSMSPERKARLEALPGWNLSGLKTWDEWFSLLKEFVEREGHAKVTQHFKTEDGHNLGRWVNTQRQRKDGRLPECKARLEALPGWVWRVK